MNIPFLSSRSYTLRKSRHVMRSSYDFYKKQGHKLIPDQRSRMEQLLETLDQALLTKDREKANELAHELESFCHQHFTKSIWQYLSELALAIIVALCIATVIRQMWFELYEIPSGSMRPTFKEQDHLTVTKTSFGLNIPLVTEHFYFDPKLVQRASVVIWSGDGVPHLDTESTFLGIFPYTKRFIKRCLGKPGDTLYFYGGKIYGFDEQGQDLTELRNGPWLEQLEYLPFINFDGRRVSSIQEKAIPSLMQSQVVFNHFNQAAGRLIFSGQQRQLKGEVFNGKEWIKDQPEAQRYPHSKIETYSDLFGIRNFALARLLTKEQVKKFTAHSLDHLEDELLYLELNHTPSLSAPAPLFSENYGFILTGYSTLIPLQERHLRALMDHMYTARFVVRNGKATNYLLEGSHFSSSSPIFRNIPDGTYEFYHGKAFEIKWGGITSLLPNDHPLYSLDPLHVQKLFNIGIKVTTHVEPNQRYQANFSNRYAYFRDGALYSLGGSIFKKEDPILVKFHEQEKQKEEASTPKNPYVAFRDYGPPLKENGEIDSEFLKTFGLKIPSHHYLVLGDNHAMSNDSRFFGPVPEANLQGAPSLIIWPPGSRWGFPNQKPYPIFTGPRLFVWGIVGLIGLIGYLIHRRRMNQPIFKKLPHTKNSLST